MFILLFSFVVITIQQGCLIPSLTDPTKCLMCAQNYSLGYTTTYNEEFLQSDCKENNVTASQITYYVSATCTSSCVGTSSNPFPTILGALAAVPHPVVGQTTPNVLILIKDQESYILDSHIKSAQSTYFLRRQLINLVIQPDPSTVFQGKPTIYIKTALFSIFVAGSTTLSGLIISGRGINEQPIALYQQAKISCTNDIQATLAISPTGISASQPGDGVRCGVYNYKMQNSILREYYGIFTIEPIFDANPILQPLLTVKGCIFQDFYSVQGVRYESIFKMAIQLPVTIIITDTQFINIYFEHGIVSSIFWQSWLYDRLSFIPSLQTAYQRCLSNSTSLVKFQNVVFTKYNTNRVVHQGSNDLITGSIISIQNQPIDLNLSQITYTDSNITDPQFYDLGKGIMAQMNDGFSFGHYAAVMITSKIVIYDLNGVPIVSHLNVKQFSINSTALNAAFVFHPKVDPKYFYQPDKVHNWVLLDQYTATSSFLRFTLLFSNADALITNNNLRNVTSNFVYRNQVFDIFSYQNNLTVISANFYDMDDFYVDENIDELNSIIYHDNSSISTPFHNLTFNLQNIFCQNQTDFIIFEGRSAYPILTIINNIQIIKCSYKLLIWSWFGSFFSGPVYFSNLYVQDSLIWEILNMKLVPPIGVFNNFYLTRLRISQLFTFRGSNRRVDNYVLTLTNLTVVHSDEDCLTRKYDFNTIFADNARIQDLTRVTQLGTVIIQNSNQRTCFLITSVSSIFSIQSPFHKQIINSTFDFFGTTMISAYYLAYFSPVTEIFIMQNTKFKRLQLTLYNDKGANSSQFTSVDLSYVALYDQFLSLSNYVLTIDNCVFFDTGIRFPQFILNFPQQTIITNSQFNNFGIQIVNPSSIVRLENVTMLSYNRNQTQTYFIWLQESATPSWQGNPEIGSGLKDSNIILINTYMAGNLTDGMIQLTNGKLYAKNLTIIVTDPYLNQLGGATPPFPIAPISSPVILKQNSWIYLLQSSLSNCSQSPANKLSCIEGFQSTIIEAYQTEFFNSKSSFGSLIYGFGLNLYLTDCNFKDGLANKGGSIYLINSQLMLIRGVFGNSQSIYIGAHIYAGHSSVTITGTVFKNGSSLDSGGSFYGQDLIKLSITNTTFENMSVNVQGVVYSSSPKIQSVISLVDVTFTNCISKWKTISLFIQRANLTIKNVKFVSQNFSDIGTIDLSESMIELLDVNMDIQDMSVSSSQTTSIFSMSRCIGSLNDFMIDSVFFDGSAINIKDSTITIQGLDIKFSTASEVVRLLQLLDEFLFNQRDTKSIVNVDSSTLTVDKSRLGSLVIASQLQGEDTSVALMETVSGIWSTNSQLSITNTDFEDEFLITSSQFNDMNSLAQVFGRVLESIVPSSYDERYAKSLDIQGGNILMINSTIPDFAVGTQIVRMIDTTFNFTKITNQKLSILTKSLLDSFCSGSFSNQCVFLDFNIQQTQDSAGPQSIQDSIFYSYGTTFKLTSTGYTPGVVEFNNITFTSRQGKENSSVMSINNINLNGHNLSVNHYNLPMTIEGDSFFSLTNGIFQGGSQGAINLMESKLDLTNVSFTENHAKTGGAIFANCSSIQTQETALFIQDCIFNANSADESGGAIRNIRCPLEQINSSFTNNTAPYGSDFLGYPFSIVLNQIIQINELSITELAARSLQVPKLPNQTLYVIGGQNTSFVINVIDNFGQIYPLGSYFTNKQIQQVISSQDSNNTQVRLELQPKNDNNLKVSLVAYSFELVSNAIIVTEFYVFAGYDPNQEPYTIQVLINGVVQSEFYLIMLPCPQGSISTNDRCFICPNETYSLNPYNEKCDNCQQYQICNGKNFLFADAGYYISYNTSEPQQCPTMGGCLQTVISNGILERIYFIQHYSQAVDNVTFGSMLQFLSENDVFLFNNTFPNYCADGYIGPFCVVCSPGFGQTSDGLCYECSTSQTIYIQFAVSIIIVLALNYKDSIEPLEPEDDNSPVLSGVLIKQLTDFTQFVNIVVGMISNVSPDILPTLSILADKVSLFPTDFASGFDCLFLSDVTDHYQKFKYLLMINSLIPWGFIVLLVVMIIIIDKVKKYLKYDSIPNHVRFVDILVVVLVANLYNFYFYVAQFSLNIFSCLSINDSERGDYQVLSVFPEMECWNIEHFQLLLSYALPTLILYVIGIPLMFVFFISRYFQADELKEISGSIQPSQQFNQSNKTPVNENESFIKQKTPHEFDKSSQLLKSNIETPHRPFNQKSGDVRGSQHSEVQHQFVLEPDEIKKEKTREETRVNYSGFLTDNLKPEYKYWGIYIQFKKLLIIMIMILTQSIDVASASIVVLIVFIGFMIMSYRHQPYQYAQLNQYESLTDLLMTIIIHLSLLIIQSESPAVQVFAVLFILVLKFSFYYFAFRIVIKEYLAYIKGEIKKK